MKNRVVGAILIGMLIMTACSFFNSKEAEQMAIYICLQVRAHGQGTITTKNWINTYQDYMFHTMTV